MAAQYANFFRSNLVAIQPVGTRLRNTLCGPCRLGPLQAGASLEEFHSIGVEPDLYVETIRAGVNYLGLERIVDHFRIGALGVSGSGSFVISAAKIDSRIKAVTTVSMYDKAATRDSLFKSQSLEQRKAMVEHLSQQRWVEAEGGEVQYGPKLPYELPENAPPTMTEFCEFYRTARQFGIQ